MRYDRLEGPQGIMIALLVEAAERIGRYEPLHNAAGQMGGMVKKLPPARGILEEMPRRAQCDARLE